MPLRLWLVRAGAIVALLAVAAGFAQWGGTGSPASNGHDLLLLYVGADDCLPCRTWQHDAGAGFRSSQEFARILYREVKSPHLLDLLDDRYWPDELRRYRDGLDREAGVPLWLIISNGEVVERASGISQWQSTVLPKLRALLR